MQGWRRLQQSIPGAGENVAGSQAILSQPLLASFRKDWRVTRLDSSYWRGCKGSQAVIFRFYTPQLLCPFFFFFTIKKKAVSWDDCSHPKLLGCPPPIFLSALLSFHIPLFSVQQIPCKLDCPPPNKLRNIQSMHLPGLFCSGLKSL